MAKVFMVKRNGILVGEFSGAQVKSLALSGKILPSDLIRESGSEKWVVASEAANLEFAAQEDEASIQIDMADESVVGRRDSHESSPASRSRAVLGEPAAIHAGAPRRSWLGTAGGLAAAVIFVVTGFGLGSFFGNTSRGWYDYGNGMVNLDLVRGISGSCLISWKTTRIDQKTQQETVTDSGNKAFNLNANSRIEVQAFIANLPAGAKLTGGAMVRFDDFTLTLLPMPETTVPAEILAQVEEWQADYVEIQLRAIGKSEI
ncbi:hypothetical protein OAG01_00755 [bacterium]|nr:hypothetical protein [bacterium]